ncbi:MAG TPA: hypothetical protein VE782_13325 [Myxococcaceae bacterium]|nr:hypothetical protein [Myxococcaceae bacterium]
MRPQPETVTTPPRMRRAVLLVLVITFLMGMISAVQAYSLGDLEQHRTRAAGHEFGVAGLFTAVIDAQLPVLEEMQASRGLLLGALASACLVGFFSALRMVRPEGVAREALRRVLVLSLLGAAVLRTIDGAQEAAVAQRSIPAVIAYLRQLDPGQRAGIVVLDPAAAESLMLTVVLVQTALVIGALLLLAQYFRSEKVKQFVTLQDQQLER